MSDLNLFVSALENIQVAVENERSLAEHKAISGILSTVFPPISPLPPSAEPKRQKSAFPVSTLRDAAAKFCTAGPGAFLEHIILPLKK
jgi:hypothetical protein